MLFRYLLAPAILLALAFSALAEAPSGPVAIGQAQLQKGDFGSVGLVQAAAQCQDKHGHEQDTHAEEGEG